MSVNEELVRLVKENPGLPIVPVVYIKTAVMIIACFVVGLGLTQWI